MDRKTADRLYLSVCTVFVLKLSGNIVDVCGDTTKINSGNAERSFKVSPALSCVIKEDIEPLDTWNIPGETYGKWNYNILPKTIGYIKRLSHENISVPSPIFDPTEWTYDSISDDDYMSSYTFVRAVGGGHVMPLSGDHYFLDSRGYYRLFDNNDEIDRVVINVKYSSGPFTRWVDKGYVTNVYVLHDDMEAYVSTGFRGVYATVDNGTQFSYTDTLLQCDSKAKIYAAEGRFKSSDDTAIEVYKKNNPNILLPPRIRNKLKIIINDDFTLFIENVNRFNLQPCRVTLMLKNESNVNLNTTTYNGIIIDRRWCIPINTITDTTPLPTSTNTDNADNVNDIDNVDTVDNDNIIDLTDSAITDSSTQQTRNTTLKTDTESGTVTDTTTVATSAETTSPNATPTTLTTPSVELNKEWE